jgi:hypothetical protein
MGKYLITKQRLASGLKIYNKSQLLFHPFVSAIIGNSNYGKEENNKTEYIRPNAHPQG